MTSDHSTDDPPMALTRESAGRWANRLYAGALVQRGSGCVVL